MITFYPRDLPRWRNEFNFNAPITLTTKDAATKGFRNRAELIEFLKDHGVKVDTPSSPLEFIGPKFNHFYNKYMYIVMAGIAIGYFTDDYRE